MTIWTTRYWTRFLLAAIAGTLIVAAEPTILFAQPPSLEQTARIRDLVHQLGAEKFADREAAHRELSKFGEMARSALAKAAEDKDIERSTRAKSLLGQLAPMSHLILDALDQPIANAKIVLLTGDPRDFHRSAPRYATAEGQFGLLPDERDPPPTLEVSHPDYGVGRAKQTVRRFRITSKGREEREFPKGFEAYRVPLVHQGTEQHKRAVKGVVLAPDGTPLADVVIRCQTARTAGQGLIQAEDPAGEAVTDANGKFSLYLPNQRRRPEDPERGNLIPPQTRYDLQIASIREDCFPTRGMFSNRVPVEIRLPRAGKRHEFKFALEGQEPRAAQNLGEVVVAYSGPDNQQVRLSRIDVVRGRRLATGAYVASYYVNGATIQFEPINVTTDSPETLVFKVPNPTVYFGRVVNGATGEPQSGAWVAGYKSTSYNNLAVLGGEDWDALEKVEGQVGAGHPAVELLSKHYGIDALVRADEHGKFEITQSSEQKFYGLLTFDKDFVPILNRCHYVKLKQSRGDVGEIPLFPAAKVTVDIEHEGRVSASPEWIFEKEGQPAWSAQLKAADNGSTSDLGYDHWMKLNEAMPIFVPSGVPLRIRFSTPYQDEWAPAVSKPILLEQGDSFDLGKIEFTSSIYTTVKVFGPDGNPLEGVPVRRMYSGSRAWSTAHNTNQQGEAFFYLHPDSDGLFRALQIRDDAIRKAPNLAIPFSIETAQAAKPYEISLNKAQLEFFRNE